MTSPTSSTIPPLCWDSKGVVDLCKHRIDRPVIEYAVHTTLETVDYALGREPSSSLDRTPYYCKKKHGPFAQFVWRMICTSRVSAAVVLVALVYIKRAKPHLRITTERWACERIFVGALVLAGKYLNDRMMKNVIWARCSGIFEHRDVGRMEREMLNILDWDLSVHEDEILAHQKYLPTSTVSTTSAPNPTQLLPLRSVGFTHSPSIFSRPTPTPMSFVPANIPIQRRNGSSSPRLIFGPGVRVAKAWSSPLCSSASSVSSSSTSSPALGNRLTVLSIANNSSRDSLVSVVSSDSL